VRWLTARGRARCQDRYHFQVSGRRVVLQLKGLGRRRPVAVVGSDAGAEEVVVGSDAYEDRNGERLVAPRSSHDPPLLKPSPHLIDEAFRGLVANPAAAALVGYSFTDIEAAHSAGVASIGYANEAGKRERMVQIHAGTAVISMAGLTQALRAYPRA
jgi:beta-phosphoglucomutase-like phosphatase (HAD superfamily)